MAAAWRTVVLSALVGLAVLRLGYLELTAGLGAEAWKNALDNTNPPSSHASGAHAHRRLLGVSSTQELITKKPATGANDSHAVPTVYVITPTYERLTQKADLTRLMHTLMVATRTASIFWIVVEDAPGPSKLVSSLLARSELPYAHLYQQSAKGEDVHLKAGATRNEGVLYLRSLKPPPHPDSVVYFADDDNVYDDRLFAEILTVRNIGVWPVGYSGQRRAEFPYIKNGRVTGFNSYLAYLRRFPMDMASFAINIKYFLREVPLLFDPKAPPVFGETMLLESTGESWDTLEPKAANCSQVLVWHIQVVKPIIKPGYDRGNHIAEV
eukprot:m.1582 g.1582  ORF g.1582 m.1582 type:complete len:325 (+) comp1190_c0_seq1:219-1193(+)